MGLNNPRRATRKVLNLFYDSLFRNSFFLIANSAVLSLAGFAFWTITARTVSSEVVGFVSAIIAAATLIASFCYLGFDSALIKFLPLAKDNRSKSEILSSAITVSATVCGFLSLGYIFYLVALSDNYGFVRENALIGITIFFLPLAIVVSNLLNNAVIAYRVTYVVLLGSLIVGLSRIALVVLDTYNDIRGILLAYGIAILLGIIFLTATLVLKLNARLIKLSVSRLKSMANFSGGNYLANISNGAAALLFPSIVLGILGSDQAAFYYTAALIASALNIIPLAIAQSLFAEAGRAASLTPLVRRSIKMMLLIMTPAILFILLAGKYILGIFGEEYASNGYLLLIFLSLTAVAQIPSYIATTVLRVKGHIRPIVWISFAAFTLTISMSYIGLSLTHELYVAGIGILVAEVLVSILYIYQLRRLSRRTASRNR